MKLKLKTLSLGAGRPVAFINDETARKLNVHVGDRLEIRYGGKKIIAITDISKGIIKPNEISLSDEVIEYLSLPSHSLVDISLALEPRSNMYIYKKLEGKELSKAEIDSIIKDLVNNALTEAEVAYFVSGVYKNGMSLKETIALTDAIVKTGSVLKWHTKPIADKHCIGGIPGNRTTPLVVSICAAAGVTMPKISSRAITSAAGTADTMETITRIDFTAQELKKIVKKTNACLAWGGPLGLAPADDKLIRVEHVMSIDPEAQLIASILAKKISAGSSHILIDIPFGEGAKVSNYEALALKRKFLEVASHFKLKMRVVLTDGSQPIGNGIGPYLEMQDVLRVLRRRGSPIDLEQKAIFLAGNILEMVNKAQNGQGQTLAREILYSGRALKKFEEIISAQGRKDSIQTAKFSCDIASDKSGKIKKIDNHSINLLARTLGCPVDKAAGIYLHKHKGDEVKKGQPLLAFYSESSRKLQEAMDLSKTLCPIVLS